MATNDEGPGKGPVKPSTDQPGAKKPTAIIDLKPTSVGVEDPKKAAPGTTGAPSAGAGAAPGAGTPGKSEPVAPGAKPATAAGPAAASSSGSVPASGAKPAEKPADKGATAARTDANAASAKAAGATASGKAVEPPAAGKPGGVLSALTHLVAGLAGGLFVLFGAETLAPQLGIDLPRNETAATRELAARLAAVESTTRSAPAVPADVARRLAEAEQKMAALDQVRQRVGEIDERQAQIAAGTKSLEERLTGSAPDEATAARVARLEDTLSTLSKAAGGPDGGRIPQLAAISGRLTDLESTLSTQLAQLRKSVVQDVESRLGTAQENSEAARTGTARIDRDLATQKSEAARLKSQTDRLEGSLKAVEEVAGSLRSSLDSLRAEVSQQFRGVARPGDVTSAVDPVAGRVASLEQSLKAVESSEAARRANVERIVLALELGNLKRAVERGGGFAQELAQVRRLAGQGIDLAPLERFKDQGITPAAALLKDYRDIVHRVIEADRPAESGGIVDRLMAGAKSIVRVRKTDAAADDTSTEAITARMEAALRDGRLADVAAEAARLPEPSRKVAQGWLERVEASAAVERAIASVETELRRSLAAAPAAKGG